MFKSPTPTRLAALPPAPIMYNIPLPNRFTAFLQAHDILNIFPFNRPEGSPPLHRRIASQRFRRLAPWSKPRRRTGLQRFRRSGICSRLHRRSTFQLQSSRRDRCHFFWYGTQATRRLPNGHLRRVNMSTTTHASSCLKSPGPVIAPSLPQEPFALLIVTVLAADLRKPRLQDRLRFAAAGPPLPRYVCHRPTDGDSPAASRSTQDPLSLATISAATGTTSNLQEAHSPPERATKIDHYCRTDSYSSIRTSCTTDIIFDRFRLW